MRINLPSKIRAALYVLTAVGTPIAAYLLAKGIIGELEISLWGGLVTVVNSMAALNTYIPNEGDK